MCNELLNGVTQSEQSLYEAVNNRFATVVSNGGKLFTTDAEELYEAYLSNLPIQEQHIYNCNACKHFITRFGGLVTISESGEIQSAIWNEATMPKFFANSIKAMNKIVLKSKVTGVFLSEEKTLGFPKTGAWRHIYATQPQAIVHRDRLKTSGQAMAEKREEFGMVNRALQDFTAETVAQALELINAEVLYRGDKVKGNILWFDELAVKVSQVRNANVKRNLVWLAIATAPTGFTHIRSSAAGTLLKNIALSLSVTEIAEEFRKVMDPNNYMRSQSGPSAAQLYEAEKVMDKLGEGVKKGLFRRYATIDEIPALWKPKARKVLTTFDSRHSGGIFGNITPKERLNAGLNAGALSLPHSVMTWEKFQRTVLPTAAELEVMVDNPNRLMALVTAADSTAENILQWDNTFSWYYHGGIDGEIKRRVQEAGGRYENNELRVSLIWEGLTDLDLHCITPTGEHIYYSHKRDRRGGFLDLDMNGIDKHSQTPVENMRWSSDAPQGKYKFYVHNYNEKANGFKGTSFKAELEINGVIYHYDGQALRDGQKVTVFEFNYVKGQLPSITNVTTSASNDSWNIPANKFVKVNAVTTSPNLWGEQQAPHAGTHIFFLLDECKDLSEGKGRGFFNEMLKPELRQIRRVLEAYTGNAPIEGLDEANACGLGYNKDSEWNLMVKVGSGNSSRIIKIDRWD